MTPAERLALYTTPVRVLGRTSDQIPADAWRRWGRGQQWTDATARPRLALAVNAWSWPVWNADRATTRIRVWRSPATWDQPARWATVGTQSWPQTVPWSPSWRAAWAGEDGGVLIDESDGAEGWEILNLRQPWFLDQVQLAFRTFGAYRPGDWICDQLARRTKTNAGTYHGRGCGNVPKRVGITTAAEVARGEIGHALALTGLTQWGTGATFVAPATRVEHPTTPPKTYPPALGPGDRRALPHGTRLAISMTDYEIDAWAVGRGYRGTLATTAATFVRALRDWGAILSETGTGDPQVECSGLVGGDGAAWSALGVTEANALTLLDGLPWDRVYVVRAP